MCPMPGMMTGIAVCFASHGGAPFQIVDGLAQKDQASCVSNAFDIKSVPDIGIRF